MAKLTWNDVLNDPLLQNLPYKIELNRWGRIEMSPASNRRGMVQVDVAAELRQRPGGRVIVECSIQTSDGVRVADVAWISDDRLERFGDTTPFAGAPELCVEIMSPANTWAEMHIKAGLYLEAGAEEVWIQTLDGQRTVIEPPAPGSA
jgi:Uma2 family endonuclease